MEINDRLVKFENELKIVQEQLKSLKSINAKETKKTYVKPPNYYVDYYNKVKSEKAAMYRDNSKNQYIKIKNDPVAYAKLLEKKRQYYRNKTCGSI